MNCSDAAQYRSKGRLPVVDFRCATNGAVMCRSAQPLVGLSRKNSEADVQLLNLYRIRGDMNDPYEVELPSNYLIMDARKVILLYWR